MKLERTQSPPGAQAATAAAAPAAKPTPAPVAESRGIVRLGVDVGLLIDTTGVAAVAEKAPVKLSEPVRDRQPEPAKQDSPLAPLAAHAARSPLSPPRDELAQRRVGLDVPVELPLAALASLAGMEAQAEVKVGFDTIRRGNMLLTSDAQALRTVQAPNGEKAIESLAQQLATNSAAFGAEEAKAWLRANARALALNQQNVSAYVQRVLRESYVIQNEILADVALRLQFQNELKRKIREQLNRARQTKTAWATEPRSEKGFLADPPFDWIEFDDDGRPYQPVMTAEDEARWNAITAAAVGERRGTAGNDVAAQYKAFYGPSQLTADDRAILDEAVEDKGNTWWSHGFDSENDDYIRGKIDRITDAIRRMNSADVSKYVPAMLDILIGSDLDADEEEVLEIYGALNPIQLLYLHSSYDPQTLRAAWEDLKTGDLKDSQVFGELAAHMGEMGQGWDRGANAGIGNNLSYKGLSMIHDPAVEKAVADQPPLLRNIVLHLHHSGKTPHALLDPLSGIHSGLSVLNGLFNRIWGPLDSEEKAEIENRLEAAANEVGGDVGMEIVGAPSAQEAARLLASLTVKYDLPPEASGVSAAGRLKQMRTPGELEDYIKQLEDKLSSVGDDAQMLNVDLQNDLQKQQQTLQMLSNISKILHDTALAIVRKQGS